MTRKSVFILWSAIFLTAFIFLSGDPRTHAQTVAPGDLRGAAAIDYLKRTDGYDSLAKAVENANAANQPAFDSLFVQRQILTAGDGAAGDLFGSQVAISGDTAVVGADRNQIGANQNQGAAYVFVRSGAAWTQQAKLTANDGQGGDNFGFSVAISGETIAIGAPFDDVGQNPDQGAIYIFVRSGASWLSQDKLTAPDGAAFDRFGYSVAISGDTVLTGASAADIGADTDRGAAYVFVRSGNAWTEQQKLTAADGATGDFFGLRVCLSSGTALVGVQQDDIGANVDQGSVYVFTRSGTVWSQQTKLTASDGAAGDRFGLSLDLSLTVGGTYAVIGAWNDDVAGNVDQGSAYVFVRSQLGTWSQQAKLTAADGADNDFFGRSVTINSTTANTIVVGADHAAIGGFQQQGAAYVFKRDGANWTQTQKLTGGSATANDQFGGSVAIAGETLIAGASDDTIGANNQQGAAYIFNLGGANPYDFDGDGKADVSVFRPASGQWWINRSFDGSTIAPTFGTSTDRIAPGDFTGDGKSDVALFRPSNGSWYILRSEDGSFFSFPFGANGDVPAPADYDGDGKTDPAVFRPANATWYISQSSGGTGIVQFGAATDLPVTADYDGDGKSDVAIFRPSDGSWWYLRSSDGQFRVYRFGTSTDKCVPGDYTGDGKADIAVFRPASGTWFVQRSDDNSFFSFPFGATGDIPAPADYDGDGKFDSAVFRPSTNTWYLNRTIAGVAIQQFGASGDRPVPNAFVP
ncbi:MAG: VCBS repeat-containing protein [Acidobacteria bacterium]|nr:VCBS repeat-containing protein [Acidobacteriota bacterium]